LLDHIAREDGALPPLLLQTLSADEDAELLQRWQEQIASITAQPVSDSQSPTPSLTLTDLNGRIHAWLDECLLRHLEALTACHRTLLKAMIERRIKRARNRFSVKRQIKLSGRAHKKRGGE
jgi:hypothetical protein